MDTNFATIGAVAVCAVVLVGGCSFEPIREVKGPDAAPQDEPASLAFVDDEPPTTTGRNEETDSALTVPAAPWVVATDSAVVGVNSAPGTLYTRLGVLAPGETVLATGRRAGSDEAMWMEITWNETTAWVLEAAFAPTNP